jgi:prophage regulatory protein
VSGTDSGLEIAPAATEVQEVDLMDSAASGDADYLGSLGLERLTGIPASTWRYWAINDTGPHSFKLGRRRVWRRADVLAWIAEQDSATGAGG